MTVEQPTQAYNQCSPDTLNYQKISEVTGVTDRSQISDAIKKCKNGDGHYDLVDVISVLTDQEVPQNTKKGPPSMSDVATSPRKDAGEGSQGPMIGPQPKQVPSTVIDLTNEGGGDIQKAIAASLQETPGGAGILGGQISHEEQEISKALEASWAESKAGTKRKRGDLWFVDPRNPHERKRTESWPVGLKNVGNTCWFSAVIQSLFHLPVFRNLVLNFKPPLTDAEGTSVEKRNFQFMTELRQLFALMMKTKRKYVDPSKAVEILKEAFTCGNSTLQTDSQQDVSEFQHKLLEWLEEAFRNGTNETGASAEDKEGSTNPMVKLFYGQYLAEGINEGKQFTNKENFGQFPLQVRGFKDIHESLEDTMAQAEIETVNKESTQKSGQEQWFTCLPPVLTFELSRFQFSKEIGRPEKIHNKLEFPAYIYMDRYMESNKTMTRQKREEVKRLKERLRHQQAKLDKFVNYGSGPKRFPLQDVLQYALEFAESQQTSPPHPDGPGPSSPPHPDVQGPSSSPQDIEMESPPSSNSSMQCDPLPDIALTTTCTTPPRNYAPTPKHVSTDELHVLQSCLHRWRTEVEADVKELQDLIHHLENSINDMYNETELNKCQYRLHAVLVHEGQAASGHYWAYIYDTTRNSWLKFNDITVTDASWEELARESCGGYHNTSAYCLMYVDMNAEITGQVKNETFCDDLQQLVEEDNARFMEEIHEWDTQRKSANKGGDGPAPSCSGKVSNLPSKLVVPKTLAQTHANLTLGPMAKIYAKMLEQENTEKTPAEKLSEACQWEMKKYENKVKMCLHYLPKKDTRLDDAVMFFMINKAPDYIIWRGLYEQFWYNLQLYNEQRMQPFCECAKQQCESLWKPGSDKEKVHKEWHIDYSSYRIMIWILIHGMEEFYKDDNSYFEALPFLFCAYKMNSSLTKNGKNQMKGMDEKILGYYRRQCLGHVNEMIIQHFEGDVPMEKTLNEVNNVLLPCYATLSSSGQDEDENVLADMREKWCHLLATELGAKNEKLQDFLPQMFDPPVQSYPFYDRNHLIQKAGPIQQQEIIQRYQAVMDIALKQGDLEKTGALKKD